MSFISSPDLVSGILTVPAVVASSGTPVTVYSDNATESPLASVSIPANTIPGNCVLCVRALFAFSSAAGGKTIFIKFGSTSIGTQFPSNAIVSEQIEHLIYIGPTAKTQSYMGFLNNVIAPTNGQGAPWSASSSAIAGAATINLTTALTFSITGIAPSGSTITLQGWELLISRPPSIASVSVAPAKALACWGDSLTAGSGAVSPVGGWPSQLGVSEVTRPIANLGVGGETASQILTRILADPVRGKLWRCVFEMGRNNVGTANFQTDVLSAIASAVANLSSGTSYLVCSVTNSCNESIGSGNWNSIQALNLLLSSGYGTKYADVMGTMTSAYTTQIPISYRAATATTTATGTSGTTTMTVASAIGIVNGQFVSGVGIPDQTTITISGTTVTLSQALTGNLVATAVQFVAANEVHFNDVGYAVWKTVIQTALTANGM